MIFFDDILLYDSFSNLKKLHALERSLGLCLPGSTKKVDFQCWGSAPIQGRNSEAKQPSKINESFEEKKIKYILNGTKMIVFVCQFE